jgi:uncharacterized membrane protein HdeD (DUF308 family)
MFVGSKVLHKNPTARWLVLFGPLSVVMGIAQIITSERTSISSMRWKGVRHSSEFYALLGIIFLVLGLICTVAGVAAGINLSWFA